MLSTYKYPKFEYRKPAELAGGPRSRHPVVVVGAGPVGLAAAIDLAQAGTPVVLLDDDDTVSVGSRGVCYAKRTLEIIDRLGVGDAVCDKGVSWNVGRTFFREEEVYNFNLLPQHDHKRPGMINLQQYYFEEFLTRRAQSLPLLDLRWKSRVLSVAVGDGGPPAVGNSLPRSLSRGEREESILPSPTGRGVGGEGREGSGVTLQVETPDGIYALDADWLIVADGARSNIRRAMGLEIEGKVFMDRFLIADVVMKADFPAERWFWFDPPFHPGQSVLLHRQADNVFRIDFQLGWQADPEEEKKPENVIPRIKAMLGEDREFELEWVSVYTFQCRRMKDFRAGPVLFVGDVAHQVSPFGARGANSGIQDSDNLVWKLKLVLDGHAPESLLDSYSAERIFAADENLMNSTRSTDFITPKSKTSLTFRNAVLGLARKHPFARALVNSGRLSVPSFLTGSPLNTPDVDAFKGDMIPGAPMDDAPVKGRASGWLLDEVGGRFALLCYLYEGKEATVLAPKLAAAAGGDIPVDLLFVAAKGGEADGLRVFEDYTGRVAERYDARPGTIYLLRPDQHVAARWRSFDAARIAAALARSCGK